MAEVTVYHNPRCTKSRNSLTYLEEKGVHYDIHLYLEDVLKHEQLREILDKLEMKPQELLRKNEAIFKDQFKSKNLADSEWIDAMIKYPKLMERPIIVSGDKAVVARPTEKINELFD
jgi:arsenate reductase